MADERTLKERILTMLSLGTFYSNFKATDVCEKRFTYFEKIVEAAKEDAAEDVFSKISSYLEDLQKTKTLCRLGWSFRYMPSAILSSKRNVIVTKALNHEELAAGLKGIFARQKLVPPIDP